MDLCGKLATLNVTGNNRIWSSTTIPDLDIYAISCAYSYGENGGIDRMAAIGEDKGSWFAKGSQRPALHESDNYNTYYSST